MNKLLALLGSILVLGGCTAMFTAPVTMPIWIVLGCVFVVRPVIHRAWRVFTVASLLQSLFIALFGFFGWYDLWRRSNISPIEVHDIFLFLFLLPAIATIGIILAMILAKSNVNSRSRRSLILLLDILAAAFTIGPVLYMMTHY